MNFFQSLPVYRQVIHALVALVVVVVPIVVAVDHGGVLAWDWWLLAGVAMGLVIASLLGKSSSLSGGRIRWAPPLLLLLFAGFAAFQTVSLSASWVRVLSPGSADAFEQWLPAAVGRPVPRSPLADPHPSPLPQTGEGTGAEGPLAQANVGRPVPRSPLADSQAGEQTFPISVSADLSRQFAGRAVVVAAFAFVAVVVFANPQLVPVLLMGLALLAALHGVAGIYQRTAFPGTTIWGGEGGAAFGFFVNSNNAAALLNAGLSGAVGVVAWKLSTLTFPALTAGLSGERLGTRGSTGERLGTRGSTGERLGTSRRTGEGRLGTSRGTLIFAGVCGLIAVAAIIASGSRGALVGVAAGFAACLLVVVPAGRFLGFGLAAVMVFIAATFSLTSLGVESRAVDRLNQTIDQPVVHDARLDHWPDAIRAAVAYLPLGAGMGTYRYAYLPYQQTGGSAWFVNADNLWLEWLVEGGLVAVLLILAGLVIVGLAIRRLLDSPEPVDRGMAAAGSFCLVSMVVSQAFDFALLLSPVAIATVLLLSAVVSRAAMVRVPSAARRRSKSRSSSRPRPSGNEARLAAAARPANPASRLARPQKHDPNPPAAGTPKPLATNEPTALAAGAPNPLTTNDSNPLAAGTPTAPAANDPNPLATNESWALPAGGPKGRAANQPKPLTANSPKTRAANQPKAQSPRRWGMRPVASAVGSISSWFPTLLGLGLILCLVGARAGAAASARSQGVVLTAESARGGSHISVDAVLAAEALLSEHLESQPADYDALLERASTRVELFRLQEAFKGFELGLGNDAYRAAYEHSALGERRKELYDRASAVGTDPEPAASAVGSGGDRSTEQIDAIRKHLGYDRTDGSLAHLHAAAADARAALAVSPLSPEPRIWLAQLDFATGESQLTANRLSQVAQLRSRTPANLNWVADAAADSHHWSVARDAWKQVIRITPGSIPAILKRVRAETPLRSSEVIPNEREAILTAARDELRTAAADEDLLQAALEELQPALSDQERILKAQIIKKSGKR